MEKLRADRLNVCATRIQTNVRRFLARLGLIRVQKAVRMVQAIARQKLAVKQLQDLRREKAAIAIQTKWRGYVVRKNYLQTCAFIINLQTGM